MLQLDHAALLSAWHGGSIFALPPRSGEAPHCLLSAEQLDLSSIESCLSPISVHHHAPLPPQAQAASGLSGVSSGAGSWHPCAECSRVLGFSAPAGAAGAGPSGATGLSSGPPHQLLPQHQQQLGSSSSSLSWHGGGTAPRKRWRSQPASSALSCRSTAASGHEAKPKAAPGVAARRRRSSEVQTSSGRGNASLQDAAAAGAAAASSEAPRCRSEALARYRAKRARRSEAQQVRYELRAAAASARPRYKGRFLGKDETAALQAAELEQQAAAAAAEWAAAGALTWWADPAALCAAPLAAATAPGAPAWGAPLHAQLPLAPGLLEAPAQLGAAAGAGATAPADVAAPLPLALAGSDEEASVGLLLASDDFDVSGLL